MIVIYDRKSREIIGISMVTMDNSGLIRKPTMKDVLRTDRIKPDLQEFHVDDDENVANEIYKYEISDGSITQLSDNYFSDYDPRINSQGDVLWKGGWPYNIYIYEKSKDCVTQLTCDNVYENVNHKLNEEGQAVWIRNVDSDTHEIYFYDGSTVQKIATSSTVDSAFFKLQLADNGDTVLERACEQGVGQANTGAGHHGVGIRYQFGTDVAQDKLHVRSDNVLDLVGVNALGVVVGENNVGIAARQQSRGGPTAASRAQDDDLFSAQVVGEIAPFFGSTDHGSPIFSHFSPLAFSRRPQGPELRQVAAGAGLKAMILASCLSFLTSLSAQLERRQSNQRQQRCDNPEPRDDLRFG